MYNLNTHEVEAGELVNCEASLSYITRPCLKNSRKKYRSLRYCIVPLRELENRSRNQSQLLSGIVIEMGVFEKYNI